MVFLPDINLLVALFDSRHVNHVAAHRWFGGSGKTSWATCPITENGVVRVMSNPSYPTVSATPVEVLDRLRTLCALPGHDFWPDDVSLLNALSESMRGSLQGHQQVTDYYLVCLAAAHGGKLATFDGSLARSVGSAAASIELLRE
jgi:toxin-antitoxin system PIN domain toxin